MKIITTVAALAALLTLTPTAAVAAPPLRERVSVCRSAEAAAVRTTVTDTGQPCIYLASLQGDGSGHSFIAYPDREHPGRLGLVRWLTDDRARFLWLPAVARAPLGAQSGSLYERVNLCTQDDGSQSSLPCIWHSPTMTGLPGESYVVRRNGLSRMPVSDAEGRRLLLVVAYRR